MKTKFILILIASLFLAVSCEKAEPKISAPTYGIMRIYAQFADESISTTQFTTIQEPPFGDTIRILFPAYFPVGSTNPIDLTNMRMSANLPVNVYIEPKLTVMDLTKPNEISVINSDGTVDKHVIIKELYYD